MLQDMFSIPGLRPVFLTDGQASTSGGSTSIDLSPVKGLDPEGRWNWHVAALEVTAVIDATTTTGSADRNDVRAISPTTVTVDGWPGGGTPYAGVRGDALRWMLLDRYGRVFGSSLVIPTSSTNLIVRQAHFLPFAGMVGWDMVDSAPHAPCFRNLQVGRESTIGSSVTVNAWTWAAQAWVFPYHKEYLPLPFFFNSNPAATTTQAKINVAADRLHSWFVTDVDDAVGTSGAATITQLLIGNRNLIDTPRRFDLCARMWNRSHLHESSQGAEALSEVAPEMLSLYAEALTRRARFVTKAMPNGSATATYGAIDATLADIHEHSLVSWRMPVGSQLDAAYRVAAKIPPGGKGAPMKAGGSMDAVQRIDRS